MDRGRPDDQDWLEADLDPTPIRAEHIEEITNSERALLILFGFLTAFIGFAVFALGRLDLSVIVRILFGVPVAALGAYFIAVGVRATEPPTPRRPDNRERLVVGERLLISMFAVITVGGTLAVLAAEVAFFVKIPFVLAGGGAALLCGLMATGAITPPDATDDDYRRRMREIQARRPKH